MFTELTGRALENAVDEFRERIGRELTLRSKTILHNPGGIVRRGENHEIDTPAGLLSIVVMSPDEHPTKYIHAINADRPDARDAMLRFNASKAVDGAGKAGGLFVSDTESGEVYLCSRGAMTVYRQRLRAEYALDHFRPLGSVIQVSDRSGGYEAIRIGGLTSPALFHDLARFAKEVERLKQTSRSESVRGSRR